MNRKTVDVFHALMKNGWIDRREDHIIWSYADDVEIQEELEEFKAVMGIDLFRAGDRLYMIPTQDNDLFLKNNVDYRRDIKADNTVRTRDLYLMNYLSIYLIYLFFNGEGSDPLCREFISKEDFVALFTEHCKSVEKTSLEGDDKEQDYSDNFRQLASAWLSKLDGELSSQKFDKCLISGESGTSHTLEVHRYYKCRGTRKGGTCKKKTVKKKWIEEVVILLIQKFIFDDELLDRLADMLIAKLNAESSTLPILRKQLDEIEKGIENLVNAIQAGILTASTKQRLEQLEAEKSEISVQILKEEIAKPTVTKDDILAYLIKYRKLNMKQLDHRRRLIDSFVNAIYLFDDYLVITFNYKEGTKRVTFAEIEEAFGSDLSSLTAPKIGKLRQKVADFYLLHIHYLLFTMCR